MQASTFCYTEKGGWSIDAFPEFDSETTLVIVFAAPEFINHYQPFEDLAKHFPKSHIVGCSSAGEILNAAVLDHSISVSVVKFNKTTIKSTVAEIKQAQDSYKTGEKIAKDLIKKDLRGIFVLSEGLEVNGSDLVDGINSVVSDKVIVTGGLAGDGSNFKETWCIYKNLISKNSVVAVGFYGDSIVIGHGSQGGWDSFGPERRVTSSKDNILYELDNRPALALYKEYLGERASGLPATGLLFPLSIRRDQHDSKQLVRTILAVNEENQSLTFAGQIPQGYLAKLMRSNFDRLIEGATMAAQHARKCLDKKVSSDILVITISCVGRRLLLGDRIEEEVESTLSIFPENTKQIGFYSYGELSPYESGSCDLHNQTMTITIFSEME